jgi:hypothetical protein
VTASSVLNVPGPALTTLSHPRRWHWIERRGNTRRSPRTDRGRALHLTQLHTMFGPITIPYGCKLLFNTLKLAPGVTVDDVELALAEMCNVVKETYGGERGGFVAGQVFRFAGFLSAEGSFGAAGHGGADHDLVIATYWRSFDQHERSHADSVFKDKFAALAQRCSETRELGYELLWQGAYEAEGKVG